MATHLKASRIACKIRQDTRTANLAYNKDKMRRGSRAPKCSILLLAVCGVHMAMLTDAAIMAVDLGSEFLKVSVVKPGRSPFSIVVNEMCASRTLCRRNEFLSDGCTGRMLISRPPFDPCTQLSPILLHFTRPQLIRCTFRASPPTRYRFLPAHALYL